jgi:WD40 repeat protein
VSIGTDSLRDPYKGLAAFDATDIDALLFFGRERETEIVVANALASRLTVLYGPTGVGKSSLLRAGVVQELRSLPGGDAVAIAYFSTWAGDAAAGMEAAARGALADAVGGDPGDAPGSLADRLDAWTSAVGCELVLVLDQFEEVFLYEGGMLGLLPELVTRPALKVNVVVGIRDDQLARLDVFKAQIPALFSNYLRLDPLDREAARAAILGPLDYYNELATQEERVSIEPELVETVLSEVASGRIQPGEPVDVDRIEAPYLQLVLERLWDVERERRSSVLRASTLAELGGARRIVETHLERAMSALTPAQQDVAAEMFGHLVTPSGSKIAHGASDLATFAHIDLGRLEPVLKSLAGERIIRPTGTNGHAGGLYEIYHDVLTEAVLNWRTRHESETALRLERVASRRRQRRLATVAGIALAALVVMAVLTVFAFSQRSNARREARKTRAGELLQRAEAQLTVDPVASIRAALKSATIATSPTTEPVLRTALLAMNTELELHGAGPVNAGAYSPDGSSFALADETGLVRIFRLPDGKLLKTLHVGSPCTVVAFKRGSKTFATGSRNGRVAIWDLSTPALPVRTLQQGGPVTTVTYSGNGRLLLTAGGNTAKLWDARSGRLLHTLRHARPVRAAKFNLDSRLVLTVAHDPVARIWDVATGQPIQALTQHGEITDADFGPRDLVVTGSRDGNGAIWYGRTGVRKASLPGRRDAQVLTVAFGPKGDLVATGGIDGTSRLWRLDGVLADIQRLRRASIVSLNFARDGQSLVSASSDGSAMTSGFYQETQYLYGQGGPMRAAFFSPDGTTVATVSGSTARLWEPYGEPVLRRLHASPAAATSVAFNSGGTLLASGSANGRILIERAHGGEVRTIKLRSPIESLSWGRNGLLLAATGNGTVELLRSAGSRTVRTIRHGSALVGAALRTDGLVAATAGTDGVVRLWNTKTGSALLRIVPPRHLEAVALDPTGRLLAAAAGKNIAVFSARTGGQLKLLEGHTKAVTGLAFSPDGTRLVSSSADHDARVWDTRTLRLLKVLHRHVAVVSGVAFTTDGRWIATAGPAKAGVWQTRGTDLPGSFLFYVRGNSTPITSVAFSPRGDELATGARDGSIRVFDCNLCGGLSSLEAYARERLKRVSG